MVAVAGEAISQEISAESSVEPVVLGPSELEQRGAIVGAIDIQISNVFATELPEEDRALFRLANQLHITTRPDIIRQQLLLKSGASFSLRLLQESERILRSNRYLNDAEIVPVRYQDGVVDLQVRTRDVWTFKPGITFTRSGGSNTRGFEVQESNLLGCGKEVTVARRSSVDRTAVEYRYHDPRVLGSWNRFVGSYSSNSDGRRRFTSLQRPFYALDTRWAAGANALDWQRTDQRYSLGAVVDEFRHHEQRVDLTGGWSAGLRDGWVRRITFGGSYEHDRFTATDTLFSAAALPLDRKLVYPFIGFGLFEDDFEERRNQDQIERTEDFYTGTNLQGRIGRSTGSFGADRSAWLWSLNGGTAFEWQDRNHTLVATSSASGRFESGATRNLLASADANYYWRVADRQLLFASLRGALQKNRDPEKQLLLGGDSGLRGYPLRYQEGNSQALFTLEHRVFTEYYLFRLFHLGGAVFFDVGRTWGRASVTHPSIVNTNQGLLKDVGVGLRFGSSRSAFGNMIHVDLAFPLDGDTSIKRTQFLIETKKGF
ncbi:MAG: BamA/TamA family outer membrane protein [Candidatus Obscuribacterales bacterium]|nr:BamA/TamA family outer membrane protein [Steroidobacteraceae bacterium]